VRRNRPVKIWVLTRYHRLCRVSRFPCNLVCRAGKTRRVPCGKVQFVSVNRSASPGTNGAARLADRKDVSRNVAHIVVELVIPAYQRADHGVRKRFRIEMNMGSGHLGVLSAVIEKEGNAGRKTPGDVLEFADAIARPTALTDEGRGDDAAARRSDGATAAAARPACGSERHPRGSGQRELLRLRGT
jgi:hypothetical protein